MNKMPPEIMKKIKKWYKIHIKGISIEEDIRTPFNNSFNQYLHLIEKYVGFPIKITMFDQTLGSLPMETLCRADSINIIIFNREPHLYWLRISPKQQPIKNNVVFVDLRIFEQERTLLVKLDEFKSLYEQYYLKKPEIMTNARWMDETEQISEGQ